MERFSKTTLAEALQNESKQFEKFYSWLLEHMPKVFFEKFDAMQVMNIAHNLMGFNLQGNFVQIHFETCSIAMCLNTPDADLRILKNYAYFGIKDYQAFISDEPPPLPKIKEKLRIAIIHFTEIAEEKEVLGPELQALYERAKTRDHVQYDLKINKEMELRFAWRNTQKYNFLYRVAKLIYRHGLVMQKVKATYLHPYTSDSMLLMSITMSGQPDVRDFLQEFSQLKYFEEGDVFEAVFVTPKLIRGNLANLLRTLSSLTHQLLLHIDVYLYSPANIAEGLSRHPELSVLLTDCFEQKFHPAGHNLQMYNQSKEKFLSLVDKIDTGNLAADTRRKNILKCAMNIVDYTDKTNFYRSNKSAIGFRMSPGILDTLPMNRTEKFPELPFAIFFIMGKSYIGFHIRFKDLARGGVRTILPMRPEQAAWERNNIFSECYNLAYTQQKKNKDIPEGGAKAVIFIEPFEEMRLEMEIYQKELLLGGMSDKEIKQKLIEYQQNQRLVYLYQSQRSWIYTLLTLINCEEDGTLKAVDMVDYYKKPEYIYLGPDENMHNEMIEWIAEYSKLTGYKLGSAFISSKPKYGINHKEFGVTSLGVNVYMHEVLEYLGINPNKDPFTVKISGGPDGDVAGNQMLNLHRFYPKTARLLAITDVSGTIYDPNGLDLEELVKLFKSAKPIRFYPPEKLNDGGLLLDLSIKREESPYSYQTLCYRKEEGKLIKDYLIGNDTHHLYSHNLHQTIADIFIPAGGRPRTLNSSNWQDFLDPTGDPTSRAIVEAANLYLTPEARSALEAKGVLIIKDSSANKGGVICSSLEVLSGLILSEEEFLQEKAALMPQILDFIKAKASNEAKLLLSTHAKTGRPLTEISDLISLKINTYTYEILDHLITLDTLDPALLKCLVDYSPALFREKYKDRLFKLPPIHQKAIIACFIASRTIYDRGLSWSPSIVDVLPLLT